MGEPEMTRPAEGRVRIDGIVPGLSYQVEEGTPRREGPRVMMGGSSVARGEVLILAPTEGK
jgi:hypothetical protein